MLTPTETLLTLFIVLVTLGIGRAGRFGDYLGALLTGRRGRPEPPRC